jgi:hypothetical protein
LATISRISAASNARIVTARATRVYARAYFYATHFR